MRKLKIEISLVGHSKIFLLRALFFVALVQPLIAACKNLEIPGDMQTVSIQKIHSGAYWAAFEDIEPKQCWAAAKPHDTVVVPKETDAELCRSSSFF